MQHPVCRQKDPAKDPKRRTLSLFIFAAMLASLQSTSANMVSDWNANLNTAIRTANSASPIPPIRIAAIVHACIFDAVNGIARDYTPCFVPSDAPGGANQAAAAAQAGYTALLSLYPSQKQTLDAQLSASLNSIPGHQGNSQAIARGRAWGEAVAKIILTWRAGDGFNTTPPGYFGSTTIPGVWRSVPDGTKPAVFPQVATMEPFALVSHDQFRPGPPPALTSREYADAVNELKALGGVVSSRTPEQSATAQLWNAVNVADELEAAGALLPDDAKLVDSARFFALLTVAGLDALIVGMDSKYTYNLWRPYHAIRLADTDGNPDTIADPTWLPFLTTPGHQEYISNHSVITGAFMHMLASLVGNDNPITIRAYALPGVSHTFAQLSDSVDEVKVARIYAGFHYRFSVNKGQEVGYQVADWIFAHYLLPIKGSDRK